MRQAVKETITIGGHDATYELWEAPEWEKLIVVVYPIGSQHGRLVVMQTPRYPTSRVVLRGCWGSKWDAFAGRIEDQYPEASGSVYGQEYRDAIRHIDSRLWAR